MSSESEEDDRLIRALDRFSERISRGAQNGTQATLKFLVELALIVVTGVVAVLTIKSDVRDLATILERSVVPQITQLQRDVKLQDAWLRQLEQQLIASGVIQPIPRRGSREE